MKIKFVLTSTDIRSLICDALNARLDLHFSPKELPIKVRSKQNYRVQEWEDGEFQIEVEVDR